jgi:hypothetical protein
MKPPGFWTRFTARAADGAVDPPQAKPSAESVGALLQTWMNTPDLGRKQAMLKEHPELLGPEVDTMLTRTDDVRTRLKLEKIRHFFRCCREIGIDDAFAQMLRRDEESPGWIVCTSLLKALAAGSAEEVEQAIRQDPRIVDRPIREYCRNALLAKELGIPVEQIQSRLAMLEHCEQNGLDMTMQAVRVQVPDQQPAAANTLSRASAPTPNVSDLFNNVIAKFERGGADAEVGAEAAALMLQLPRIPRTSCVLVAMLASCRAGDMAGARKWAVRLNQVARVVDLPGVVGNITYASHGRARPFSATAASARSAMPVFSTTWKSNMPTQMKSAPLSKAHGNA